MTSSLAPAPEPSTAWYHSLLLGLTAIFVGYFLVWLPGPSAGLQLIGLELGEWIKFLGVGQARDLFYVPPIALGLLIACLSATWTPGGWRPWAARVLAVAVALLAFPAVAAILGEPRGEWLARLVAIGIVGVTALLCGMVPARGPRARWPWFIMTLIALAAALLPTWQYLMIRPAVADYLRLPIGIGSGVWLNALGCLVVAAVCMKEIRAAGGTRPVE